MKNILLQGDTGLVLASVQVDYNIGYSYKNPFPVSMLEIVDDGLSIYINN